MSMVVRRGTLLVTIAIFLTVHGIWIVRPVGDTIFEINKPLTNWFRKKIPSDRLDKCIYANIKLSP